MACLERSAAENACNRYLQEMTELLSKMTSHEAAEKERVHLRGLFKQLHGLLLKQQQCEVSDAGALRENDQLLLQKQSCIEQHVARMNHLKKKITNTSNNSEYRTLYTDILAFLEDMAANEECEWDLRIMSRWCNAPKASVVLESQTGATKQPTHLDPRSQAYDVSGVKQEEVVTEEVNERLSTGLADIHVLSRHHHASYMSEVDQTLAVVARVTALAGSEVALIERDILRLKAGGDPVIISAIVDKTQEKYERAQQRPERDSWGLLLERVKALRDFYSENTPPN